MPPTKVDGLQSELGQTLNGLEGEYKGMKKGRAQVKLIDLGVTKGIKLENLKTAGGIYRTNAFGVTSATGGQDGCLFEVLSRFNHACFGAASVTKSTRFDMVSGDHVADVMAVRDVAEGEELSICYLGEDDRELDAEQRREYLRMKYRFDCACSQCKEAI